MTIMYNQSRIWASRSRNTEVSVYFCHKLTFSVKSKADLCILNQNLKFLKIHKNSYTSPL
jgi:hypothetical protein